MFSPVLDMLAERSKDLSSLLQSDIRNYIDILLFFAKHIGLTEVIMYMYFNITIYQALGFSFWGEGEDGRGQSDIGHLTFILDL